MIVIRYRKLKTGKYSVYLDSWNTDTNKHEYRFLKIQVLNDYSKPLVLKHGTTLIGKNGAIKKIPVEKEDKEKMVLIENIKSKLELEIASTENGFAKKKKSNQSFTAYLNAFILNNNDDTANRLKFNIDKFTNDAELMFDEITFSWIEKFKRYLEKNLSQNSVRSYLSKFKQVLTHSVKAGVMQKHNFDDIEIPVKIDAEINPLTIEEVQLLAKSPVKFKIQIKQAFLFSCFTGLRQSDVMNLKWSNIDLNEGVIKIIPIKTSNRRRNSKNIQGKILEAPLTESAKNLLLEIEKKQGTDLVFYDLPIRQIIGKHLMIWGLKLGLKKHIHFHLGRHTFATIGITYGIDVYGMQKLLLHSKIEQTQRYAKVVEQKIKNDVSKFPTI
jgi:site-specific recombinase XerD